MLLGAAYMNPEWGIPFIAGSPYGAKAKTVHDDLYAEGCCYNRLLSYAYLYLAADLYGNEEAAEYVAQLQNILKPGEQKTIHSWFEQFEVFPNVGSYYKPTKMLPLDFSHLKPAH